MNDLQTGGSEQGNQLIARLAKDYLKEKKATRRWGIAFKLLLLGYLVLVTVGVMKARDAGVTGEHTALVELNGVIAPEVGVTADQMTDSLRRAFEAANSRGVILRINSPGGTPVQAAEINQEITRLKALYPDKPFYSVISDTCASGGYYVAVAADTIYANPASLVGSIGVLIDSYGFVDAMQKLGVERRLITAGDNKGLLDPFSPLEETGLAHAKAMLDEVHEQFIDAVRRGRGERLTNDSDIFSGLFWSGERAKALGLIDEFGDANMVAREVIGAEELIDYTIRKSFWEQFAQGVGVALAKALGLRTASPLPRLNARLYH